MTATDRPAERVAGDHATAQVPAGVAGFLAVPTPATWVDWALSERDLLLVDHANCEQKAAASALAMMHRYPDRARLVERMSRLAREELRHFEQVRAIMRRVGVPWRRVGASRYAADLHAGVRGDEPARRLDSLIVGAFIEARSCERFALLVPHLDEPLKGFYAGLLASEARHFRDYLELAGDGADAGELHRRVADFAHREAALVTRPDRALRFHSGPPA